MQIFSQGDVIRVPFPYTDRSTRQHRPALIVSNGGIGAHNALLWVVMITSAANRICPGDLAMGEDCAAAGLPAPSIIRPCKIATIETQHAQALGRISAPLMREVARSIRGFLS